jgi:hypothetical protein
MPRSLSLVVVLAAGLALPAIAESAAPQSAKASAQSQAANTTAPFKMVRTLGGKPTVGGETCSRFMVGQRVIWYGPKPPQAQ